MKLPVRYTGKLGEKVKNEFGEWATGDSKELWYDDFKMLGDAFEIARSEIPELIKGTKTDINDMIKPYRIKPFTTKEFKKIRSK